MFLGFMFGLFIIGIIFIIKGDTSDYDIWNLFTGLGVIAMIGGFIFLVVGIFHGFINYPPTEGTHQGIITAVDLEGVWFRRYEVYLKSSGYTNQSDETKYLIYDYEKSLAEELKSAIGKEVQLNYGHDGGYIPWNSCGTYHIKSFTLIEGE